MKQNHYEWRLKKARRDYICNKCFEKGLSGQQGINKGDLYWRHDASWASAVYHKECCPIECDDCTHQGAVDHMGLPRPYCDIKDD